MTDAKVPQLVPGPPPTTFKSWHHGPPVDEELCVTLMPSSAPTTNRLQRLSDDLDFQYNAFAGKRGKLVFRADLAGPADALASSAVRESRVEVLKNALKGSKFASRIGAKRKRETGSSSGSKVPTTTSAGQRVREMLREWGFDLVSLGIGSASSTSQPPLSGLDANPAKSLLDPAVAHVFDLSARRVEMLLASLDLARTWTHEHLNDLCLQGGGTSEEVRELQLLFGQDLAADFIIETCSPIGTGCARAGSTESQFNFRLDETVIQATNAILRLIGIAGSESDAEALAATGSRPSSERAAASLLLEASRRHLSGCFLRLVDTGSGNNLPGLQREILSCVRPDWVLVSGLDGQCMVHGVVESEPHADPSFLVELTERRVAPLTATATLDKASSSETSDVPGPSDPQHKRPRRQAAPRNLRGRSDTPERRRKERNIMERPFESPHWGYVDSAPWQKLALQLSSQMLVLNVRNALLWAHWANALLPAQLIPAEHDASEAPGDVTGRLRQYALAFAPSALHLLAGPSSSPLLLPGLDPAQLSATTLRFHGRPNLILSLVRWALYAQSDRAERGSLLSESDEAPWAASAEDTGGHEDGSEGSDAGGRGADEGQGDDLGSDRVEDGSDRRSGPGKSEDQGRHGNGGGTARGSALTDRQDAETLPASSSTESMAACDSASVFSRAGAPASSPPSSPCTEANKEAKKAAPAPAQREQRRVRILPFARGGFADVHRGSIIRPGAPDQACVYKFNRHPTHSDGGAFATASDKEAGGPIGRFQKELHVLKSLAHLQGSTLPRLFGTSRVLSRGRPNSPPALILEDVGEPIHVANAWPESLPLAERRRLVEQAYERLYEAGWTHGDVATRNILVSATPATDGNELVARVCIVDFARARRCHPDEGALDEEWDQLQDLLDDIF